MIFLISCPVARRPAEDAPVAVARLTDSDNPTETSFPRPPVRRRCRSRAFPRIQAFEASGQTADDAVDENLQFLCGGDATAEGWRTMWWSNRGDRRHLHRGNREPLTACLHSSHRSERATGVTFYAIRAGISNLARQTRAYTNFEKILFCRKGLNLS